MTGATPPVSTCSKITCRWSPHSHELLALVHAPPIDGPVRHRWADSRFLGGPVLQHSTVLLVWYIAVAAIGTAAYLYRELLHPFFRPLWQHTYTVEAVNQLDRKTLEVTLAPVAQPVPFVAGQFVFVRFGGGHGWEPHHFTISSAPQESLLHLAIKGL